jgi:ribosome-binding factor A
MSSRRVLKAAQAIREVVSMAIIADLKDPRIQDVTVTLVEVTPDMRQAKVNVSVMGDETKQKLCIHGLQNSAGYLQQKVGKRIDTRYTPRLQFVLDKGIQHSMLVTRILDEVISMERGSTASGTPEAGESDNPEDAAPAADVQNNMAETDSAKPGDVGPAVVDHSVATDPAEDPN